MDLLAKLLQVLQESRFTRLGGNREVTVDVRVLCATNRRLEQMVREGTFREDLFFRLNVVTVMIPPLRERRDEIPVLVDTFMRRFSARYRKRNAGASKQLMRAFDTYPFPGNVRELENIVKRAVVLEREDVILEELRGGSNNTHETGAALEKLIDDLEGKAGEMPLREVGRLVAQEAERATINQVLGHTHWNRKQAARLLNVSYKTLLQKIRYCGLEPG